jgi:hypothetical protein
MLGSRRSDGRDDSSPGAGHGDAYPITAVPSAENAGGVQCVGRKDDRRARVTARG